MRMAGRKSRKGFPARTARVRDIPAWQHGLPKQPRCKVRGHGADVGGEHVQFRSVCGDEAQTEVGLGHAGFGEHAPHDVFSGGNGRKRVFRGRDSVGQAGEQTRSGFLLRQRHAGFFGKQMYIVFGQSGKSERGGDAKFPHGPQARTEHESVGSVGAVAQRQVGNGGQRGEHGFFARVAALTRACGHGRQTQRIDGNLPEFKGETFGP